jgi:hypothetical protein
MKASHYRYRKIEGYESAYDVRTSYGAYIGEVDRYSDNGWTAELTDGRRGYGRTRADAIAEAKRQER